MFKNNKIIKLILLSLGLLFLSSEKVYSNGWRGSVLDADFPEKRGVIGFNYVCALDNEGRSFATATKWIDDDSLYSIDIEIWDCFTGKSLNNYNLSFCNDIQPQKIWHFYFENSPYVILQLKKGRTVVFILIRIGETEKDYFCKSFLKIEGMNAFSDFSLESFNFITTSVLGNLEL
jgi:hypothetical protein